MIMKHLLFVNEQTDNRDMSKYARAERYNEKIRLYSGDMSTIIFGRSFVNLGKMK